MELFLCFVLKIILGRKWVAIHFLSICWKIFWRQYQYQIQFINSILTRYLNSWFVKIFSSNWFILIFSLIFSMISKSLKKLAISVLFPSWFLGNHALLKKMLLNHLLCPNFLTSFDELDYIKFIPLLHLNIFAFLH